MKFVYDTATSVDKIDIAKLISDGKRFVIIDLDNTIARWKTFIIKDAVAQWIDEAKSLGIEIGILSNNINKKRTAQIAQMLSVKHCVSNIKKPSRKAFEDALEILGADKKNTVVIGDQLFVDIKGANKTGIDCILVDPIYKREAFVSSFMRIFEKLRGRKVRWQDIK